MKATDIKSKKKKHILTDIAKIRKLFPMSCKQQFGFDDVQQGNLFDYNEALNLHVFYFDCETNQYRY